MEKLTVEASGEQYVTVSMVVPLINCTINNFSSNKLTLLQAVNLKEALLKEIDKRFGTREQVHLLAVATFLDPRFKNFHFNDPIASTRTLQKIISLVLENLNSSEFETPVVQGSKEIDLWSFHKSLREQHMKSKQMITDNDIVSPEICMYLAAPLTSLHENPLQVWEELKTGYPNLYSIARKYLSVVCTSVPSERHQKLVTR